MTDIYCLWGTRKSTFGRFTLLLYVNDLPTYLQTNSKLNADDTNIFIGDETVVELYGKRNYTLIRLNTGYTITS